MSSQELPRPDQRTPHFRAADPPVPDLDRGLPDVPDPSGPPVAVKKRPFQFTLRSLMLGTMASAGVCFVLSRNDTSCCMGASRSSRLKWQERQLEIEQVEQQGQIEQPGLTEQAAESVDGPLDSARTAESHQHE